MSWLLKYFKISRKSLLIVSCSMLTLVTALAWFIGDVLVAPAHKIVTWENTTLPVKSISIPSKSGSTLAGWLIPNENNRGTILLFHGIRSTRGSMIARSKLFYNNGFSIITVDFQAHGKSEGNKITLGHLEQLDVQATVDFAKSLYPNYPIGIIGVSLGGAATILASPTDIDAVILESVYPDIRQAIYNRVQQRLGYFSYIPTEILLFQLQYRLGINPSDLKPIDKINLLKAPVLIISGLDDKHTTEKETISLFQRAEKPKELWLVEGAAHIDLYDYAGKKYEERVLDFLNKHM